MRGMKPNDSCWNCQHLTSKVHTTPPVFCRAFPRGSGIPLMILSGQVRHDRILGDEWEPVTFKRREERNR